MDRIKTAISKEIRALAPADRVRAMRGLVQFVVDEYTRVLIKAGQEQRCKVMAERSKKKFYYYPGFKPFPTVDEILAMSREETFEWQTICRFRGHESWIVEDRRFFDEGRDFPFYKKFLDTKKLYEEIKLEPEKAEYFKRSEHSYSVVENELTTDEIMAYANKVKSGEICFEIQSYGFRSQLSPLFMHAIVIDGEKWPSVEHYILAQQLTDKALQDKIRETKTVTLIRKLIRGQPIRADWPEVRDSLMTRALEQKFLDDYLCASLLSTHGLKIKVKHADPYWQNRLGDLMATLREKLFAVPEKRALVGIFK